MANDVCCNKNIIARHCHLCGLLPILSQNTRFLYFPSFSQKGHSDISNTFIWPKAPLIYPKCFLLQTDNTSTLCLTALGRTSLKEKPFDDLIRHKEIKKMFLFLF